MKQISGDILTPAGWHSGVLHFDRRIVKWEPNSSSVSPNKIVPGFIDLHVHGGHGADVMEGEDAIRTLARWHARHGTTSLLATTLSAPMEDLKTALGAIGNMSRLEKADGARVLGGHLEGPFINPDKLGAQPPVDIEIPSLEDFCELCDLGALRVMTVAAEMFKDKTLITQLAKKGIRVQIGHSLATYEEAVETLERGASGFTHLFNAMSGLHHRSPGAVGAALAKATYSEIIPDLFHVHEGAILAALRAIPKLYCVTDASGASGMPDGTYHLGSQLVSKCPNGVFLDDGTIAGSTLTMGQAFRNMIGLGLSEEEASLRVSTYAADYLGLQDRGRIAVGAFADLVVLDGNHHIQQVFVEGEAIELSDD